MVLVDQLSKLDLASEREIYKRSFYEFYKKAFCQLHPGLDYDENWHAKYICDILQEETFRVVAKKQREHDIIINVPPRSSKSMIVSVIWPVWSWTVDPKLKFISGSYSDTLATNHSRLSKDLIESNWFQRLYGHKVSLRADLQGAGHYANTETGFRYAFGLDGTVTGMGGDFVIVDDIQNPKKANSEVERESTIQRYNETISNRLNQLDIGGRIIVMQRLHERDITGYLMDPKSGRPESHRHICIPAVYNEKTVKPPELKQYYANGLFWPTRFSKKVLADEKKKGSLYFAGQFGQTPTPPEGNLFKRRWFDIIDPEKLQRDMFTSPMLFIIDTAYKEKKALKTVSTAENDPNGLLTCFRQGNYVYVVNFTEIWCEFPDLIKFIREYVAINGYGDGSAIYIEPKASGVSVVQQLRSETDLNVIEIDLEFVRDDKLQRASAVSPICEGRRVKLVNGDWNDQYLGQLTSFPKAQHDEAVDCTVHMLNIVLPVSEFFATFA